MLEVHKSGSEKHGREYSIAEGSCCAAPAAGPKKNRIRRDAVAALCARAQ
jgi:hypothetical protein